MKQELDHLIDRFRAAQDLAVDAFVRVLNLPLPSSGRDWVRYCSDNGLYEVRHLNGVGFYAHGYGVELKLEGMTIDFDWGPEGETDGFDGWRLYNFTLDNKTGVECTHDEVNAWLGEAHAAGELILHESLYFDPERRAASK